MLHIKRIRTLVNRSFLHALVYLVISSQAAQAYTPKIVASLQADQAYHTFTWSSNFLTTVEAGKITTKKMTQDKKTKNYIFNDFGSLDIATENSSNANWIEFHPSKPNVLAYATSKGIHIYRLNNRRRPSKRLTLLHSLAPNNTEEVFTGFSWVPSKDLKMSFNNQENFVIYNFNSKAYELITTHQKATQRNDILWNADGSYFASTNYHSEVSIYDQNCILKKTLTRYPGCRGYLPTPVAWSPKGALLAHPTQNSQNDAPSVGIYDLNNHYYIAHIPFRSPCFNSISWNHDGRLIALSFGDAVEVWYFTEHKPAQMITSIELYSDRFTKYNDIQLCKWAADSNLLAVGYNILSPTLHFTQVNVYDFQDLFPSDIVKNKRK